MERKRTAIQMNNERTNDAIHTLASTLVGRANLSARMNGSQYGGDRDIYQALGYPQTLLFSDYASKYLRQDMAKAIIDRPAKATWQGELLLRESMDAKDTKLEVAWNELEKRLSLKSRFLRVDRLSAIGRYGVLLLGLDDVKSFEDFRNPVTVGNRTLLYVRPFGEGHAKIQTYESNTKDPRFGMPLTYLIENTNNLTGQYSESTQTGIGSIEVHHSRIIHVIDDILENEVIGVPRLESVFNRLMDLEKIVGGDAEMFWRGARPGFQGKVDKDYSMTPTAKDDLLAQIDEYEHNLRRMLVNEGVTYEELKQQIADPSLHVDIQIQMISAVTGIPKRILTGTERGELSSSQDANEYRTYVTSRREDHAEVHIVRVFVDRCIEYGILPKPSTGKYSVLWSNLFAISESEMVKIGLDRANALNKYATTPMAEAIMPPKGFLEYFLGFTSDQIDLILKYGEEQTREESIVAKAELLDLPIPGQQVILPTPEKGKQMQRTNTTKPVKL